MIRSLTALSLIVLSSAIALGQDSDSIAISRTAKTPLPRADAPPVCARDYRSDSTAGVLVLEVVLEGVTTGSSELLAIKSQIEGSCFDDQSDLIGDAIQAAFSDRGFAQAQVENVTLKVGDRLTVPKPVTVKAEITEGPRFRIGAISFTGNHAFSAARLRAAFLIKKGALFQHSKIASGLKRIRELYTPKGFLDLVFMPDVMFSSTGTVDLTVTIIEGQQYHMGALKIYAKKEISERAASDWNLREGAVFDGNYPQEFVDKSHSLPAEFAGQNVVLVRDCPEATVTVMLVLDQTDPGLQNPPEEVRCKKSNDDGQ
ncbi:MAG TPA: POTRA domain-containing protein [Terriglobales bacterium]|nr:POTRA domain-containing protein [Terriglobales bacterium]